jgi:hypothetical protein
MDSAVKQACDTFMQKCHDYPDRLRVFAQGDSWLSLPGGLWSGRNVVEHLNAKDWIATQDGGSPLNILSVALPGKTIENMAGDADLHYALTYLQLRAEQTETPYGFDAVMVSGGGNDVLANPRALIAPDGKGDAFVREDVLDATMQRILAAWQSLFNVFSPWHVPILTNGYGPIIPTTTPAPIRIPFKTIGPWVGGYLIGELGLSEARSAELVNAVLARFNATLAGIGALRWFDLRPVVAAVPADAWHDEIHFLEPGWTAVSAAWLRQLRQVAQPAAAARVAMPLTTRAMRKLLEPDLAAAMRTKPRFVAKAIAKAKRATRKPASRGAREAAAMPRPQAARPENAARKAAKNASHKAAKKSSRAGAARRKRG